MSKNETLWHITLTVAVLGKADRHAGYLDEKSALLSL